MNKSDATAAFLLILLISVVCFVVFAAFSDGYTKGEQRGRREVRKEAIERGLGEYKPSSDGHNEFIWATGAIK